MPAPIALTGAGNVTTNAVGAGTSVTANKPSNVADGDLLVAAVFSSNTGISFTPPSGWTQQGGQNANRTYYVYTKPIPSAAAESATNYSWSWTGSSRGLLIIARVTGADLINPLDVAGTAVTTGTSIVAPSVTTVQAQTLLLGLYVTQTASAPVSVITPPGSMATVGDITVAPAATSDLQLTSETLSAAGATGTRTATCSPVPSGVGGFLLALDGAPSGLPPAGPSRRRFLPPQRIRFEVASPPGPAPAPPVSARGARSRRTWFPPRRGVEVAVVPAQVVATPPPYPPSATRARRIARRWRRGAAVGPVPAQLVVQPPAKPPAPSLARRAARFLRRPEAVTPVPVQPLAPPPTDSPRPVPRSVRQRRGRSTGPVPTQVALPAPTYPPRPSRRRIFAVLLRRGRRGGIPVQPGAAPTTIPKAPRIVGGTRTGPGAAPAARGAATSSPGVRASAATAPGARAHPDIEPGTRTAPTIEGGS